MAEDLLNALGPVPDTVPDFAPPESGPDLGPVPDVAPDFAPPGSPSSPTLEASNRKRLLDHLQKNNLFQSATGAFAADEEISRQSDGTWRLPALAESGDGLVKSLTGAAAGLVQKVGLPLQQKSLLSSAPERIHKGFSDLEKDMSWGRMEIAWKDLAKTYAPWEREEKFRILSDGVLLPNPENSDWLDPEKAEAMIAESDATEQSKDAIRQQLPDTQSNISLGKLTSYAAAASASRPPVGTPARLGVKGFEEPMEWHRRVNQNRENPLTFGSPEFVLDYEKEVINPASTLQKKTWGLMGRYNSGLAKVTTQVAGLAGLAGSDRAAQTGAEMSEATGLISQGSPDDLGLAGAVVEEIPSLATMVVAGRVLGTAVSATVRNKATAQALTSIGVYATAGSQSAGLSYSGNIAEGMEHEEAKEKALKAGLVTTVVTAAFGVGSAGGVERLAAGGALEGATVGSLITLARKEGLGTLVKSPGLRQVARASILATGGEATEEGIDEYLQAFVTADPDESVADAWDNAIEAAKVGGLLGTATSFAGGDGSTSETETPGVFPEGALFDADATPLTPADPDAVELLEGAMTEDSTATAEEAAKDVFPDAEPAEKKSTTSGEVIGTVPQEGAANEVLGASEEGIGGVPRVEQPPSPSGEDVAYQRAVEEGNVEDQQRLMDAAAERAGWVKSKHATGAEFTQFDREKIAVSDPDTNIRGFHFSNEATPQSSFRSQNSSNNRVLDVYLNLGRTISRKEAQRLVRDGKEKDGFPSGFDTVIFREGAGEVTEDQEIRFEKGERVPLPNTPYFLLKNKNNGGADLYYTNNPNEGAITGYEDLEQAFSLHQETHYVVNDPSQIQFADPGVFDEAGKVAPLSQRFPSTETPQPTSEPEVGGPPVSSAPAEDVTAPPQAAPTQPDSDPEVGASPPVQSAPAEDLPTPPPAAPPGPTATIKRDEFLALPEEKKNNVLRNADEFGWEPETIGATQEELNAWKISQESKELPPEPEAPGQPETLIRYTVDGTGLLNNEKLDRGRLSDEEESELMELMDFGLEQPQGVEGGAVFYFTPEGDAQHARLLELLKKAATGEVDRTETPFAGEMVWQSGDGQVAITPTPIEQEAATPPAPEPAEEGAAPPQATPSTETETKISPEKTVSSLPTQTVVEVDGEQFTIIGNQDDGRTTVRNKTGGYLDLPVGTTGVIVPVPSNPYADKLVGSEPDFEFLDRLGVEDPPAEMRTIPEGGLPLGTISTRVGEGVSGNAPPSYFITPDGRVYDDSGRSMMHGGASPFVLKYVVKGSPAATPEPEKAQGTATAEEGAAPPQATPTSLTDPILLKLPEQTVGEFPEVGRFKEVKDAEQFLIKNGVPEEVVRPENSDAGQGFYVFSAQKTDASGPTRGGTSVTADASSVYQLNDGRVVAWTLEDGSGDFVLREVPLDATRLLPNTDAGTELPVAVETTPTPPTEEAQVGSAEVQVEPAEDQVTPEVTETQAPVTPTEPESPAQPEAVATPEVTPEEGPSDQPELTGVKYEALNKELKALGYDPLPPLDPTNQEDVLNQAAAAMEADPAAGPKLIDDLVTTPRQWKDETELRMGQIEIKRRKAKMARAAQDLFEGVRDGAKDAEKDNLRAAYEIADMELQRGLRAAGNAQSMWGKAGRASQDWLADDFTLVDLANRWAVQVNEGVPLSDTQLKEVGDYAEQIKQSQAHAQMLEDALNDAKSENAEHVATMDALVQVVEKAQKTGKMARVGKALQQKEADILARIEARRAAANARDTEESQAFLSPDQAADLKDYVTLGAIRLSKKFASLGDYTAEMVKTLGEWALAHASKTYRESLALYHDTEGAVRDEASADPQAVVDAIDPEEGPTKKDIWDLARTHVIAGKRGTEVMDNVFNDLQPKFPDLTKEEVQTLFTGYGTIIKAADPESVQGKLFAARSLELTALKLLDVQRKQAPKRTGQQRGEKSDEERVAEANFRKAYRDALAQGLITSNDPARDLRTTFGAVKRRMENEIADLKSAVEAKEPRATKEPATFNAAQSAELAELKTKLEQARAEYKKAFPKPGNTMERRQELLIASLDRQIAAEEKMISEGVFERTKGEPVKETPEIAKRREKLAELRESRRALDPDNTPLAQAKAATTAAIERLQDIVRNGLPETKVKTEVAPDAELRALLDIKDALADEVKEMRKALPLSPAKLKAQIQRSLNAAEASAKRIQAKLDSGDLSTSPKSVSASGKDPAVVAARERVKALNKELARRRREALPKKDPEEMRVQRALAGIKRQVKELERRKRENDYEPKAKVKPVTDARVKAARRASEALKREVNEKMLMAKLAQRSSLVKGRDFLTDLSFRAPRAVIASFDAGAFGRQGWLAFLTRPGVTIRQFGKNLAFSEKAAEKAEAELEANPRYQVALDAKLSLTSWRPGHTFSEMEEMYRSRIARSIPGVVHSERSYVSYLNAIRMAHFDALYTSLEGKEGGVTDANLALVAKHVNALTGRGHLGRFEAHAEPLAMALFSPKYWWSRLQVMGGVAYSAADALSMFKWLGTNEGKDSNKAARKILAIERARLTLGLTAMYSLLSGAAHALSGDDDEPEVEVSLNPLTTDFGKIKFSNGTRIDPGAGMLQNVVFVSQMAAGKRVSSVTGEDLIFAGEDKNTQGDWVTESLRMLRKKLSPSLSAIVDVGKGTDILGRPTLPESELAGLFIPISVTEAQESYADLGLSKGTAALLLNLFGFGSSTYGEGSEETITLERKAAEKMGGILGLPEERYYKFHDVR